MQKTNIWILAGFLVLSSATVQARPGKKPVKKAVTTAIKRKPLYVQGRVMTMGGRPLSGVEVGIYGTTARGDRTRFEAFTNANGTYSQRVPDGIYGVSAYYKTKYNGKNYNFTLHPEDGKTGINLDAVPGIVKNFRWKISGLKPGETVGEAGSHTETTKFYGGYVYVTSQEQGTLESPIYFPAGSALVMTMTPRAKLIDGSIGKPKTFSRRFDKNIESGISWHLSDIPVGMYTLTAQLKQPDGTTQPLRLKKSLGFNDAYTPSINVDFEPTSYGDMQMMQVTVKPLSVD